MRKLGLFTTMLIVSTVLFLTSCNKEENNFPPGQGRLKVHLTDAPFPVSMVSKTMVTIDKVEIRQKSESSMNADDGSFIVLSEQEMQVDLLQLTNGITEQIAVSDLDAGHYDMIRLHVVNATIELKDGSTFNLKVPSGSESGIKIKIEPEIHLFEGQTYDVLLDFDINRSFIVQGNIKGVINGFIFKPVVRGVFLGAAGRIEGKVTDTLNIALENALVKAWPAEEGMEVSENVTHIVSSFTDFNGNYRLIGMPEGKYNILCFLEGFKSDTLKNVTVNAGGATKIDFKLVAE